MSESATTEQDAPAAIAPAAAGGSGVARAWPADRAARVYAAIDLGACCALRRSFGGPAPESVHAQLESAKAKLDRYREF